MVRREAPGGCLVSGIAQPVTGCDFISGVCSTLAGPLRLRLEGKAPACAWSWSPVAVSQEVFISFLSS